MQGSCAPDAGQLAQLAARVPQNTLKPTVIYTYNVPALLKGITAKQPRARLAGGMQGSHARAAGQLGRLLSGARAHARGRVRLQRRRARRCIHRRCVCARDHGTHCGPAQHVMLH